MTNTSSPTSCNICLTLTGGAATAAFELLAGGQPMDRIKTHQQAFLEQHASFRRSANLIYRERGVFGFYEGFRWNALHYCSKSSYRWLAMNRADELIRATIPQKILAQTSFLKPALLGVLVGGLESLMIICPSESLKTKEMTSKRFLACPYLRAEGVVRVFDGWKAVLARQMISWTSFMTAYQKTDEWMRSFVGKKKKDRLSTQEQLVVGASTGILNVWATTPIDVIKTQMQTLDPISKHSVFSAIRTILLRHGLSSMTRGVTARSLRAALASSINLLALERLNVFKLHS